MTNTKDTVTYTWEEARRASKRAELEGAYGFLYEMLIPPIGPAATTAGEAARAYSRVSYRFYNDGDKAGGNDSTGGSSVNAPWRYLRDEVGAKSPEVQQAAKALGELTYAGEIRYGEALHELGSALLKFLAKNPNMMTEKNEKDSVCGKEFERPEDYEYDQEEDDEEEW